jgi:signal transduction histidine kinase
MSFSFNSGFENPKELATPLIRNRFSALVTKAEDRERRRIARELHDGTGQTLALLIMNLDRIGSSAVRGHSELRGPVSECARLARQVLEEIRATCYLLHPPTLEEFGLTGALERYIAGFQQLTGIGVACHLDHQIEGLSSEAEIAIFRMAQECLTNVFRHSGSRTAAICLTAVQDRVVLEVKDSGKGISIENLMKIRRGESCGVGLRGIRERARSLGGSFEVSAVGRKTRIRVEIPTHAGPRFSPRRPDRHAGALYQYFGTEPQ